MKKKRGEWCLGFTDRTWVNVSPHKRNEKLSLCKTSLQISDILIYSRSMILSTTDPETDPVFLSSFTHSFHVCENVLESNEEFKSTVHWITIIYHRWWTQGRVQSPLMPQYSKKCRESALLDAPMKDKVQKSVLYSALLVGKMCWSVLYSALLVGKMCWSVLWDVPVAEKTAVSSL